MRSKPTRNTSGASSSGASNTARKCWASAFAARNGSRFMSDSFSTRQSLLLQIRDLNNDGAWSQFVDAYAPLVYRYARRQGLQDADAADITQDVLRSVVRTAGEFVYDPARG